MKLSWIFAFLKLCTFNVVDGDVGNVSQEPDVVAQVESTDEITAVDAADVAWNELNSDEGEGLAQEVDVEPVKEAIEPVKAEDKPLGITDDDLKPLESKNIATNERFQKITEGYKSEKERADALEQQIDQYKGSFDSLKQLGFNDAEAANDLVEFSAYRHTLATGDVNQFKGIIEQQIKQFELMHGKKVNVSANVLEHFPDLQEKVNNLQLDEETAIELSRARALQSRANRENQRQAQEYKTEQQQQAILNDAVTNVTNLEASWRNNDPDYNAILPHLQPLMADIRQLPPNLWAQTIDMQYKALKKALMTNVRQNQQSNQPLRGNGHMSGKPAPTNLQEAVLLEMGIE